MDEAAGRHRRRPQKAAGGHKCQYRELEVEDARGSNRLLEAASCLWLLGIPATRGCWKLLEAAGDCWKLLEAAELLEIVGGSWRFLQAARMLEAPGGSSRLRTAGEMPRAAGGCWRLLEATEADGGCWSKDRTETDR